MYGGYVILLIRKETYLDNVTAAAWSVEIFTSFSAILSASPVQICNLALQQMCTIFQLLSSSAHILFRVHSIRHILIIHVHQVYAGY